MSAMLQRHEARGTERSTGEAPPILRAEQLTIAAGGRVVQRELDFGVREREVFVIAGGSGCGKSTLLRHLIGLDLPMAGRVWWRGSDLHGGSEAERERRRRGFGVAFQAGALWSSMSVGENVMLPLQLLTPLSRAEREQRARDKLALVGLEDAFDREPAALSGGMRKRAAIARALALDPVLLFLDEPSAGLDPVASRRLDELILGLRERLGTTVVMVSHELDSIFAVADRVLFLDAERQTMTALGPPALLRDEGPPAVREFFGGGQGAVREAVGLVA